MRLINIRNTIIFSIILFILLLAILLLPAIFNDRTYHSTSGPDLSEIKYTEVTFKNNDINLAGMLFLPEGNGPFPTAVIIHGSGPSSRNNRWYLSIVNHLQKEGIAVLLPDKRGSEKSGGKWIGADFEVLATDTISAIEYIKTQKVFNYTKIGIIGISQGGWICSIVAGKTNIAYAVSLSGTTVTTDEQLHYEEINNISSYTYRPVAKVIAPITVSFLKKKEHLKCYMGFDSIPYWKNVNIPVFFAFGENDKNVPVNDSIKKIKDNKLDFNIKVYPDAGHGIRNHDYKIRDDFLKDLTDFIKYNQ